MVFAPNLPMLAGAAGTLLTAAGFYLLLGRRLPRFPQPPLILKRLLWSTLVKMTLAGSRNNHRAWRHRTWGMTGGGDSAPERPPGAVRSTR